jgi:hypothetical protein
MPASLTIFHAIDGASLAAVLQFFCGGASGLRKDGRVPVGSTVLSRYAVGRGFQEAQVEQVHEA